MLFYIIVIISMIIFFYQYNKCLCKSYNNLLIIKDINGKEVNNK